MLRPCRSSQGHGTERPSRDALWATCLRSASSGYTRSSAKVVIRSIQISDTDGQCKTKQRLLWTRKTVVAAYYKKKKDDLLHSWNSSSDISGYHAKFNEGHGTITAWWGNGMGTACYV